MRYIFFFVFLMLYYSLVGFSTALASNPLKQQQTEKIVTPLSLKTEVVSIGGKIYEVPEQWQGKRINAPELAFEDFGLIPTEYTFQQSKLFLRKDANKHLQIMLEEAARDGVELVVHSSYRSTWYQKKIFQKMFEKGRKYEDIVRYVAPPGYSEHSLGTVVDFYPSNWKFAETPQYQWLKDNGRKFDFYETYSENNKEGMPWEAWHWRWLPPNE